MKYLKLFFEFFKIGLFTFGGGLSMIPFIQKSVVEKNKWMSEDEMIDMLAISESTPGPIAINCATFVGYRVGKIRGAILSTLGVVLPSFIIILIISLFYEKFIEVKVIKWAFLGIKAGVAALILNAGLKILKKTEHNLFSFAIMLLAIEIALFTSIHTVFVIIFGLVVGVVFYSLLYHFDKKKENKEENKEESNETEEGDNIWNI